MPSYQGIIKSVTGGPSATAFTVEWTNPDPPPTVQSKTFTAIPAWVREMVLPNVGESVSVTTSGDPETITLVTVSA